MKLGTLVIGLAVVFTTGCGKSFKDIQEAALDELGVVVTIATHEKDECARSQLLQIFEEYKALQSEQAARLKEGLKKYQSLIVHPTRSVGEIQKHRITWNFWYLKEMDDSFDRFRCRSTPGYDSAPVQSFNRQACIFDYRVLSEKEEVIVGEAPQTMLVQEMSNVPAPLSMDLYPESALVFEKNDNYGTWSSTVYHSVNSLADLRSGRAHELMKEKHDLWPSEGVFLETTKIFRHHYVKPMPTERCHVKKGLLNQVMASM